MAMAQPDLPGQRAVDVRERLRVEHRGRSPDRL